MLLTRLAFWCLPNPRSTRCLGGFGPKLVPSSNRGLLSSGPPQHTPPRRRREQRDVQRHDESLVATPQVGWLDHRDESPDSVASGRRLPRSIREAAPNTPKPDALLLTPPSVGNRPARTALARIFMLRGDGRRLVQQDVQRGDQVAVRMLGSNVRGEHQRRASRSPYDACSQMANLGFDFCLVTITSAASEFKVLLEIENRAPVVALSLTDSTPGVVGGRELRVQPQCRGVVGQRAIDVA